MKQVLPALAACLPFLTVLDDHAPDREAEICDFVIIPVAQTVDHFSPAHSAGRSRCSSRKKRSPNRPVGITPPARHLSLPPPAPPRVETARYRQRNSAGHFPQAAAAMPSRLSVVFLPSDQKGRRA